jgi:hypothetical protein
MYVVGKTGTGKSHLLKMMLAQDIAAGQGCALLDPHGDLALEVAALMTNEQRENLIYLDATDPSVLWRFNPFAGISETNRALAAAGMVEVFRKLWPDDWGPRLEHVFRNVVFTLLETPDASLANIPPLLVDKDYRRDIVSRLENQAVRDFWTTEYDAYSYAFRAVVIAPLQNKIGALLTDPTSRRILTGPGPSLDLRRLMDEGKTLIVNLDKGRIGEGPSALRGSLLLSHMSLAGISRSDTPEPERRDFFIYADEFQTFTTLSVATMLSELRKFRVGLVLSHQHLTQCDVAIRDAVFGNVGTLIAFRVGAADAGYLAKEFAPKFSAEDVVNLPKYQVCVKLLIEGEVSPAFSAETLESVSHAA